MGMWDVILELVLLVVLIATLLHAVRLQRALGGLRSDRSTLREAVEGFDGSTRQAEAALARMTTLALELSAQHQRSAALKDDLAYLSDRGEGVADRLDAQIRAARGLDSPPEKPAASAARSQAERNLLTALQGRR